MIEAPFLRTMLQWHTMERMEQKANDRTTAQKCDEGREKGIRHFGRIADAG